MSGNIQLPRYKQNTSTSHVELSHFCCLLYCYFLWVHLQEGLDVTTSDFNTYTVPTYHVESEEDLLVRLMAAAGVGLLGIGDRVYQNMAHKQARIQRGGAGARVPLVRSCDNYKI